MRYLRTLLRTKKLYQVSTFDDSFERYKHERLSMRAARKAHLREFNLYRPHLAYLHQQMMSWKPRSLSELFIPGYSDRLAWYTAIFAIVFGVLGLVSVITSIVQMGLAIVALRVSQEQLRLQIAQTPGNSNSG
jgi:hypothetical protein